MELKKKRRVGEIALGFFMLTHAERIVLIALPGAGRWLVYSALTIGA